MFGNTRMSKPLLAVLHDQLPWLITIKIRNLLSYFYITSPVDERIRELRVRINAARRQPDDKRYQQYFEENLNYFMSNFIIPNEFKRSFTPISSSSSYASLPEELKTPSPKPLSEQYLATIRLHLDDKCGDALKAYVATLGEPEKFIFVSALTEEAGNHLHNSIFQAVYIEVIGSLGVTEDVLIQDVFNHLATEEAVKQYKHYLMLRDEVQRDRLGKLFSELKQVTYPICKEQVYQSAMSRAERQIDGIRKNEGMLMQGLERLAQNVCESHQAPMFDMPEIQGLLVKIAECLDALKQLLSFYEKQPALIEFDRQAEAARRKEAKLEAARHDFITKLMRYEIMDVSIQRLEELYPDETEREARKMQCEKLGVHVFDAADEEAKKTALKHLAALTGSNHTLVI